MKKSDGIVLGAIALGFIFLLKPKVNPVFAEETTTESETQNYTTKIPNYQQVTSTNNTTSYKTTGAGTYIAVLDN